MCPFVVLTFVFRDKMEMTGGTGVTIFSQTDSRRIKVCVKLSHGLL